MDVKEKIKLLEQYKSALLEWDETREARLRSFLNQSTVWVRREVIEAKCYATVTIGPPPITGGFIARDVDPFGSVFEPPYGKSLVSIVVDMVDRTIGVLRSPQPKSEREEPTIEMQVQEGYAFVAMPMDPENPDLVDVLDAIKEGARRCVLIEKTVRDESASVCLGGAPALTARRDADRDVPGAHTDR